MANKKGEKHHIVPKVYLESFTDVNGEMIKLRIDLPKKPLPTSTNPAKVCYKPNFYRFEHHIPASNGIAFPPNVLERSGFLYENSLKELIELLTTGTRVLPFGKASNLVRILFDIKIRNEYIRNRSLSPDNINRTFDNVLQEHKEADNQFNQYLQSQGIDFEKYVQMFEFIRYQWLSDEDIRKDVANTILLSSKMNPSDVKKLILNKLIRGDWTIIKPLIGNQFITSDNPGFCQSEDGRIHNTRFGGSFDFYFPLTPYHVLLISSERDVVEGLPESITVNHKFASTEDLKMINQGTYIVANREIYAKTDSPLLQTWYTLHRPFVVT